MMRPWQPIMVRRGRVTCVAVRASILVALRADGSHIEGHGIRPHVVVTPTVEAT
jgi:hypothetical protein